jgi:3-phosphoshikimate 1-carboxyvinyltransferase
VLAALADAPSHLRKPLLARDTRLMASALRALGTRIDEVPSPAGVGWIVTPRLLRGPAAIDCGLAGTVMRFVPVVAALAEGPITFDGDEPARVRPMHTIIEALRALGVRVDDDGRGTLPFTVHGTGFVGVDHVVVDASASSQFVSALMLAAARFDNGCLIEHQGAAIPSKPHLNMSVAMLRERGITVDVDATDPTNARWTVHPGDIAGLDCTIEPDLSNAAPFLAAAMVTGGTVSIRDWPAHTTQPGDALRPIFTAMGGEVTLDADLCTVTGPEQLLGIEMDLRDVGELTPVVAAVCAFASTPSQLRGIAHLRGHETDRLAALVKEINGVGGRATETEDGLHIEPSDSWRPARFETYADHRMATAGAVLGLRIPGIDVVDIATTGKTLPDFAAMWDAMLTGRA